MDDIDYRRLLFALLLTRPHISPFCKECIPFAVDTRFDDDRFLKDLVIEDLGIDPTNGVDHRYVLVHKPREKKAAN